MQNVILTPLSIEQLQNFINDAVKTGFEQTKTQEPERTNLLTRKQVCSLLNITLPTLWEWQRNGTITAYKVGTRLRFKENEVMSTLQRVKQVKFNRGV
jgi:excisionase family DNA binding protein